MKNQFSKIFVMIWMVAAPAILGAQINPYLILNGHKESVNVLTFTPDSKILLSGSKDGKIISWDAANSFKQLNNLVVADAAVSSLSINHAGTNFAAGTYRKIAIYKVNSFKKVACAKKAHSTFVESVNFSGDDQSLISSSWNENALMLWETKKLKKIKQFTESMWTDDVVFSPDNRFVISANHANVAKVWDVATGNITKTFAGHEDWIYAVRITSDQKNVISASFDKTIKIWDFESGRLLTTLEGHKDGVYLMVLSTDNKTLISYGVDLTLRIWDLEKKVEITGVKTAVKALAVALSPDNRYIAVGLEDNTVALWELKTLLPAN
jgi:WD40 repeat protein